MNCCDILIFFSISITSTTTTTIQNAFFLFFQTLKGGVIWKKSKYCNAKYLLWTTNKKKCEQKNFFKIIIINTTILFFCLMPLRAIERKHFHFSFFLFTFFAPPDFFSSEIRGLWSIKCFSEMLPKLLIFMYKKTHIKVFLFFLIVQLFTFFLIRYALVYNDID